MKTLALVEGHRPNGIISKDEIEEIRVKHRRILEATRIVLPTAIELGERFTAAHKKIEDGKWENWLRETFPDIGCRTVYRYLNLAKHRLFLEAKFDICRAADWTEDAQLERVPSIREAERAIEEKNQPPRARRRGKTAKPKISKNTIDVESTAVETEQSGIEDDVARPIKLSPPDETRALTQDKVEEPDEDPVEILRNTLNACVRHQRVAIDILERAKEHIEISEIPVRTVKRCIELSCLEEPEIQSYLYQKLLDA